MSKNVINPVNFSSKNHSTEIDSLRAIAILLVFSYHVIGVMIKPYPEFPHTVSGYILSFIFTGATGVILFFIISSFLLTIPFYLNPNTSRMRFFQKRLLRILPLYFIVVAIAGLVTQSGRNDPMEVVRSFLFLFKTVKLSPFSFPWWTLRTEIEFYLLLGLLMPLIHFSKGSLLLLVSMAAIFTGRYFILIHLGFSKSLMALVLSQSAVVFAPTFLIGIAASIIYIRFGASMKEYFYNSRIFNSIVSDFIFILILAALSFVLRKVAEMGPFAAGFSWPQHNTYEAFFWSLVLLSLIVLPLRIKPLISNKILAYIGRISYSFYLIHVPIMYYINKYFLLIQNGFTLIFLSKLLLILAITLVLSSLTYRFIEKPFLRIKDRL